MMSPKCVCICIAQCLALKVRCYAMSSITTDCISSLPAELTNNNADQPCQWTTGAGFDSTFSIASRFTLPLAARNSSAICSIMASLDTWVSSASGRHVSLELEDGSPPERPRLNLDAACPAQKLRDGIAKELRFLTVIHIIAHTFFHNYKHSQNSFTQTKPTDESLIPFLRLYEL